MTAPNTDTQSLHDLVRGIARDTKNASAVLARQSNDVINAVLGDIADALVAHSADILAANAKDISAAGAKGLSAAMIDRLRLDEARIQGMANGIGNIIALPDPVGRILNEENRPNGLVIQRVSVPIGVLGMIYESRPNVTIDAAALCLKSRNAVVLRGGSESLHSSLALHGIIQRTLEKYNLPAACVSMIPVTDRAAVGIMLSSADLIDVMIPRGGKGLTERVMNEAKMPVFSHLDGICHIYVHESADAEIAQSVTLNAKMRRTGICGAMETLLLDQHLAPQTARAIVESLIDGGCTLVGDKMAQGLDGRIGEASVQDWETEYLEAKLSVCIVSDIDEAVRHINSYGSHHTDSIIAHDDAAAAKFLQEVDSGIVMHNASTQFADGGEFGMGAEIGIATGKMHARGPVGLEQLCTYKYHVRGNGQCRP